MKPRAYIVAVLAMLAVVVGVGFGVDEPARAESGGGCCPGDADDGGTDR